MSGSQARMRVLWLTNVPLPAVRQRQGLPPFPSGGWLGATAQALVSDFPRLDLVASVRTSPAPEPFEEAGVSYVTLASHEPTRGVRAVMRSWKATLAPSLPVAEVTRLIEDVGPDVVHVHGTETPNALAVLRTAGHLPVLVSIQGMASEIAPVFLRGLPPGGAVRDVLGAGFLRGESLVHSAMRMSRAGRRERAALALAREVAGRTDWDRERVQRISPEARYWHVDEVLRETFYRTDWAGPADVHVILAVANAAPYKGLDVLLRAFARIRDRVACELHVVGDIVGTQLWKQLERLQEDLDVSGSVSWAGTKTADEVARMMSESSVVVCASRIENSSNSVSEAMLVGAPVVAPRTGGIPSLVTDDVDGRLFTPEDADGLAESVIALLEDVDTSLRLGARAKQRAQERHDPKRIAASLMEIYETVGRGRAR